MLRKVDTLHINVTINSIHKFSLTHTFRIRVYVGKLHTINYALLEQFIFQIFLRMDSQFF